MKIAMAMQSPVTAVRGGQPVTDDTYGAFKLYPVNFRYSTMIFPEKDRPGKRAGFTNGIITRNTYVAPLPYTPSDYQGIAPLEVFNPLVMKPQPYE